MQEKQGVATHLLYQLYISLGKKAGHIRGIMQPTAGSHKKEHDNCSDVCIGERDYMNGVVLDQILKIPTTFLNKTELTLSI